MALSNSAPVRLRPAVTMEKRSTPSRSLSLQASKYLLLRQEVVDFAVGMVVGGLGAVFAVLRTAPAAAVDDGA